ncbi:MAG: extensin, partial [Burkholderiales bacterium]|nr:extensin [Burkholderiales bacterium]
MPLPKPPTRKADLLDPSDYETGTAAAATRRGSRAASRQAAPPAAPAAPAP